MDRIFELYDGLIGEHVSYHKTLAGAMKAMSEEITKIAPALCRDYEGDVDFDFSLKYTIKSCKIKD